MEASKTGAGLTVDFLAGTYLVEISLVIVLLVAACLV